MSELIDAHSSGQLSPISRPRRISAGSKPGTGGSLASPAFGQGRRLTHLAGILLAGSWLLAVGQDTRAETRIIATTSEPGKRWFVSIDPDSGAFDSVSIDGAVSAGISQDGQRIAYLKGTELRVMNVDGTGDALVLGGLPSATADKRVRWSPQGDRLAVMVGYAIRVVSLTGETLHEITDGQITDFDWSPDGTKLAYAKIWGYLAPVPDRYSSDIQTISSTAGRISVMDLATGTTTTVIESFASMVRIDRHWVTYTGGDLGVRHVRWCPIANKLALITGSSTQTARVSTTGGPQPKPQGYDDFHQSLSILDMEAASYRHPVRSHWSGYDPSTPVWSPDGTELAYLVSNSGLHVIGSDSPDVGMPAMGSHTPLGRQVIPLASFPGQSSGLTLLDWIETAPGIEITAPEHDEIVTKGEPYTIRFTAPPEVAAVDLYLVANSLSARGERQLLAEDVPTAAGTFVWEVPEDLRSPSTFVVAVDAHDPSFEGVSARFRVRLPWSLYRVTGTLENPEYEGFDPARHAFSFLPQDEEIMWWTSYWRKPAFNYDNSTDTGVGPGRDPRYPGETGYHPMFFGQRRMHESPPWKAMVDAFGDAGVYSTLAPWTLGGVRWNQPNPVAAAWWNWDVMMKGGRYNGVCYGLAMAMMAAFQDGERFDSKWLQTVGNGPGLGGREIADLSHTEVAAAAHALQYYQFGRIQESESRLAFGLSDPQAGPVTPVDVLARLKDMFERDDRERDRILLFQCEIRDPDGGPNEFGAHAVVPISIREGYLQEDDGIYSIFVVEPNWGPRKPGWNNPARIFVDPRTNRWWHENSDWLGDTGTGLYLSMEVVHAFETASTKWPHLSTEVADLGAPRDRLSVGIIGNGGALTAAGGELRYENGVLTETLPGGFVQFPITGRPSTPDAFNVPAGSVYRAEALPQVNGIVGIASFGGEVTSTLLHTAANPGVRSVADLLTDGFECVSGSGGTFELTASVFVTPAEFRSVRVTGLNVSNPSGLRLIADDEGFRLTGPALATSYHLELSRSTAAGLQVFQRLDVPLAAGASHLFQPNWVDLETVPVAMEVDADGDGQPDDNRSLVNQAPSSAIWTGWDGGIGQLKIEMRRGAAGGLEFRVIAPAEGPYNIEVSRNLSDWEHAAMVPGNTWLATNSLPGDTATDARPMFLRVRR